MKMMKANKLYLASASPRRKELLERAGYLVEIISFSYIEDNERHLSPEALVMEQAQGKAHGVHVPLDEERILISADTIVVLEGHILGKPKDEREAKEMLSALSGRSHDVLTGVTIVKGQWENTFYVKTTITFQELSSTMIDSYVASGSPLDKAGAYGLQELDERWIKAVHGSYSNVVGLPMEALEERLKLL